MAGRKKSGEGVPWGEVRQLGTHTDGATAQDLLSCFVSASETKEPTSIRPQWEDEALRAEYDFAPPNFDLVSACAQEQDEPQRNS
jgi:hypothetical protein